MKKYLIQGMLALAATLMLTGCHDEDIYSGSTLDQKAKAYEETFVEAFGMPNANHNWGFGTMGRARTRTVLKEDMWDDDANNAELVAIMNNKPAAITDTERAIVKDWFEKHPGLTEGADIQNFYLQHVYGVPNKDYNVWYMNHDDAGNYTDYRADYIAQATLDYLEVGDGTNYDHINDFNANDGATWDIVYVKNGSALDFRVKSSWCSETYNRFKLAHIDSAGVDGWYVGIAMYGYKYDNGERKLNEDQKDFCDDWILKIAPGVGETITVEEEETKPKVTVMDLRYRETIITETTTESYKAERLVDQGRVLCEDLGSSGHVDIDFNDLVFDAKIWEKVNYKKETKVITHKEGSVVTLTETPDPVETAAITYNDTVMVLAAGGTLPLSFAQKGELNGLFEGNFDYLTMINTVTDQQLAPGSKYDTAAPVTLTMTGYEAINEIPIWVEFGKETKKLNQVFSNEEGSTGYIPRCLLVPLGTPWATERTPIDEAYADFTGYVQYMKECWDFPTPSAIYPGSDAVGLTASPDEAKTVRRFDENTTTSTDTQEGGEYYEEHEIEVDQYVPDQWVGTPLVVNGAGSLTQYYEGTRIGGINSNDYAWISGSQFPATGRAKLRIYGIGADNDGYVWRLYTGTASNNLSGGDMTEYSYNSNAGRAFLAANGYLETEVDAATLHSTGWYLAGTNFTLLGVTIVDEDDEKQEQGGGSNSNGSITVLENGAKSFNSYGNILNNDSQTIDSEFDFDSLNGSATFEIEFTAKEPGQYEAAGWECQICNSDGGVIVQVSNSDGGKDSNDTNHNITISGTQDFKEMLTITNGDSNWATWKQNYVDWGKHAFKLLGKNVTITKIVIHY